MSELPAWLAASCTDSPWPTPRTSQNRIVTAGSTTPSAVTDRRGGPARGERHTRGTSTGAPLQPGQPEGHGDEHQRQDGRQRTVERRAVLDVDRAREAVELEDGHGAEVGQGVQGGEQRA